MVVESTASAQTVGPSLSYLFTPAPLDTGNIACCWIFAFVLSPKHFELKDNSKSLYEKKVDISHPLVP